MMNEPDLELSPVIVTHENLLSKLSQKENISGNSNNQTIHSNIDDDLVFTPLKPRALNKNGSNEFPLSEPLRDRKSSALEFDSVEKSQQSLTCYKNTSKPSNNYKSIEEQLASVRKVLQNLHVNVPSDNSKKNCYMSKAYQEIEELKLKIASLEANENKLNEIINDQKISHDLEINKLNSNIKSLECTNAVLTKDNVEKDDLISEKMTKTIQELTPFRTKYIKLESTYKNEKGSLEREVKRAKMELNEANNENKTLKDEKEKLLNEIINYKQHISNLDDNISALEVNLLTKKRSLNPLYDFKYWFFMSFFMVG